MLLVLRLPQTARVLAKLKHAFMTRGCHVLTNLGLFAVTRANERLFQADKWVHSMERAFKLMWELQSAHDIPAYAAHLIVAPN
jgi:hypothetical protein